MLVLDPYDLQFHIYALPQRAIRIQPEFIRLAIRLYASAR